MSKATQPSTDSTDTPDLPDRDVTWNDPREIDCLTVRGFDGRPDLNGGCYLREGTIAYIVDGLDEYLDEYATDTLDVPTYYSRFDDWTTYVAKHSVGHGKRGLGVTPSRLEAAIRFAVGGGRYRTDDLTVTACGQKNFIVEYDGEAFLVAYATLRGVPEGYTPETYDVAGFDVPEDDATFRDGLRRMFDYAERFDVEITEHKKTRDGKHIFRTASGRDLYVRGNDIRKVATAPTENPEDTYEIETDYDETFEVEWSDAEYDVGDEYDDLLGDATGVVVGYKVTWEDPRVSRRVSMSGKITVDANYVVLQYVDNSDRRHSYDELKASKERERLGEFDPVNEDWSPLSVPDNSKR